MSATSCDRRHDIDALRVFAFGLLILYHVGMFYVGPGWDYHVKSQYEAEWLQLPMVILNRWRMPLVFLVSGLAMHFLRRGQTGLAGFVGARTLRLLVPLLFGMAAIVPIQPYCEWLAKGAIEPGFGKYLVEYWLHDGNKFAGPHGWTWNHLWYVAYLWHYTLVLALLLLFFESRIGVKLRARIASLRGAALLWLPALPFALYATLLQSRFPETHALFGDWFAHSVYFTAFLYGYLIGTDAGLWQELRRLRWKSLGYALLCLVVFLIAVAFVGEDSPAWQHHARRLARWSYMWLAIASILGWAHHALNRPFRWLPYANDAVYPWYVFHQSLIVPIGFALTPLALGPLWEPALVLLGTIGGCAVLHHVLVRHSGRLGVLVGYSARARRPRRAVPEFARIPPA